MKIFCIYEPDKLRVLKKYFQLGDESFLNQHEKSVFNDFLLEFFNFYNSHVI